VTDGGFRGRNRTTGCTRRRRSNRRSRAPLEVTPSVPSSRPVGSIPVLVSGSSLLATPLVIRPAATTAGAYRPTSITFDLVAISPNTTPMTASVVVSAHSNGAEVVASREILVVTNNITTVNLRCPRSTQWSDGSVAGSAGAFWEIQTNSATGVNVVGLARFSLMGSQV